MKYFLWFLFIFFAIAIGAYPLIYFFFDMSGGLLSSKPKLLLLDDVWRISFSVHIFTGGFALLIGWLQFVTRFRENYPKFHKAIGKMYVIAVLLSGVAGFYIALFATGGIVAILGFSCLAIAWLYTTVISYISARALNFDNHEQWMIRSYALCFAAVTLRFWLPLMQFAIGIDFIVAYKIVAWLCWIPNLIVAELLARRSVGVGINAG